MAPVILIFYVPVGMLLGWAYGVWTLKRGRRPSVLVAYLWAALASVAFTGSLVIAFDWQRLRQPEYMLFGTKDGLEMFVFWNALASIAIYVPMVVWVAIYQRKWQRKRNGDAAIPQNEKLIRKRWNRVDSRD